MKPEQREKYTENWRKNYKYEVVSRLKLNVKTPTHVEKKNRNY